jgi:3-hydroxyacyl-CoA dehydrogenase
VVRSNGVASLVDLGDGVVDLEFHSGHNTIGPEAVELVEAAVETAGRDFRALVIANQAPDFSVGLNLHALLGRVERRDWKGIEEFALRLQRASLAVRRSRVVVVAAPQGRALGPGCELVLHAHAAQVSSELYMGYNEMQAGLSPCGGGCVELLARRGDALSAFSLMVLGTVSQSAAQAKELDLLDLAAHVTMNADRLVHDAKLYALRLAPGYVPAAAEAEIRAGGSEVEAELLDLARRWHREKRISEHELWIAGLLAHMLSGGDSRAAALGEGRFLDLERELFLRLCGHPETACRLRRIVAHGRAPRG